MPRQAAFVATVLGASITVFGASATAGTVKSRPAASNAAERPSPQVKCFPRSGGIDPNSPAGFKARGLTQKDYMAALSGYRGDPPGSWPPPVQYCR